MADKSRLQFSVRSLLLVTTLAAVLLFVLQLIGWEPFAQLGRSGALLGLFLVRAGVPAVILVCCFVALRHCIVKSSHDDPTSPVTVARTPCEFDAVPIVDELSKHGILGNIVGSFTSGFQAVAPGEVRIVVAREHVPQAQLILADWRPDERPVDWSSVDVGKPTEG